MELIEFDALLDLCGEQHRRIVLAALIAEHRPLPVADLTEAIVEHNDHVPMTEISSGRLSEIETSLHHVHLPKLEAAGLVEYDSDRGLVTPTEQFEQVQSHVSAIIEADPGFEMPMVQ